MIPSRDGGAASAEPPPKWCTRCAPASACAKASSSSCGAAAAGASASSSAYPEAPHASDAMPDCNAIHLNVGMWAWAVRVSI